MSRGLEALRARRERLRQLAEQERNELAAVFGEWERPLRVIDTSLSILHAFRTSRWLRLGAGVAMAALAFLRPRSIVGWVVGGQTVWQLIRGLRKKM